MQVARDECRVAEVKKPACAVREIPGPYFRHLHDGHIVAEEKGDDKQQQDCSAYIQTAHAAPIINKAVYIGGIVGDYKQADD